MKISTISSQEILDSRGNPTIATEIILEDGAKGRAAVPSGASTGTFEALELRDNDPKRYAGLGVLQAVAHVNTTIAQKLKGMDAQDQKAIDRLLIELDGTENKSNLGANAILSVSLAVARAQAASEKKELFAYLTKFNPDFTGNYLMPVPQVNVINGGAHANWATDFQEYMLLPVGAVSLKDAVRMSAEVYHVLKKVIKAKGYNVNVGDEGGFAPQVATNEEPFGLLTQAVKDAGYELGKDFGLGLDAAASEFYKNNVYNLFREKKRYETEELVAYYQQLTQKYPLISLEDIFDEEDWEGFATITKLLGDKMQIVGDDLYVTNVKRLQTGIAQHATNAILIKLNQIGTLTETIDAILLARKNNMASIVSHRSGETEDTFIADLSVAMGTGQIKTGSTARSERIAKYNRLMEIEAMLGEKAHYASFLKR